MFNGRLANPIGRLATLGRALTIPCQLAAGVRRLTERGAIKDSDGVNLTCQSDTRRRFLATTSRSAICGGAGVLLFGPAKRTWSAEPAGDEPQAAGGAAAEGGADGGAAAEQAIRQVLSRQVSAWNAGEIDRFMEGYWQDEGLTFSSGGETTRGWEATRQRYHQRYATREAMGQLEFQDLEVNMLGAEGAWVLGRWQLTRGAEQLGGNFTLVFRKQSGEWFVVHDHTSLRE